MRILDELGEELVRAARAEQARPRRRFPRTFLLSIAALFGLTAVAVAAGLVIGRGDPIPPAPPGQVPAELRPAPGSEQLNGLNVPDPDGGPPWDVRTSRSQTGAVCVTVGQVLDGEFGLVGLDRRFRALPAGAADTCSTGVLAGARAFRGGGRLSEMTVVNGVAAADVQRVVAIGGGRTVRLTVGPGRGFLAIFPGTPEQVRPRLVLTGANGRERTLRFADTGEYLAPDPSGGSPWTVTEVTRRVRGDLRCVQARRERGADSPTPLPRGAGVVNFLPPSVPLRCGPRDAAFLDVQRFVPFDQKRGSNSWWGLNVARTIAWGAAPRTGAVVTLRAPGKPRRIAVDPRTKAFAVILDGKVDPRTVRLTVDGAPLEPLAGVTGTRGKIVATDVAAPPAWRSVESVVAKVGIPNPFVADRSTLQIARRADDVAGGAPWVLRAWHARVNPRVQVGRGGERDLRCFQIGHPAGDGVALGNRTLALDESDSYCNGPRWLTRHAGGANVRVEVDDPLAADPQPVRAVIAGLLGTGVRSAELLGAGEPRPLDLGPDGTFLVVLDGAQAAGAFRIRQMRSDGTVRTSRAESGGSPCRLAPGNHTLVADPDGGPPWVYGRSARCTFSGRIVAGRLAYVSPYDGTVNFGPESSGTPYLRSGDVRFSIRGPGMEPARSDPTVAPAAPQVARRTQPGRTILTGEAARDIVAVTIRSPRDVRTVKPVDGFFMAVYDGAFYTGRIVVTGRRRDGSTVVVRQPATFL